MRVDVHRRKSPATLCQNCVRYPPNPPVNTVIYGDTSTPIDVAEVVDRRVCRKELVCVRTRGGSQFPSVLLHPPPLALRSSRALARCLAVAALRYRKTLFRSYRSAMVFSFSGLRTATTTTSRE